MRNSRAIQTTLYTKLNPDECFRRLSASGWVGEEAPEKWRPTVTDRDLFRRMSGPTVQFLPRDIATGQMGYSAAFAPRFIGTIMPYGDGTRIDCRYGTQLAKALTSLGVAIFAAALLSALAGREQFNTVVSLVQLAIRGGLLYLFLVLILIVFVRVATRASDEAMTRAIRFLEETLETEGGALASTFNTVRDDAFPGGGSRPD